jgi:hypothetical protein
MVDGQGFEGGGSDPFEDISPNFVRRGSVKVRTLSYI